MPRRQLKTIRRRRKPIFNCRERSRRHSKMIFRHREICFAFQKIEIRHLKIIFRRWKMPRDHLKIVFRCRRDLFRCRKRLFESPKIPRWHRNCRHECRKGRHRQLKISFDCTDGSQRCRRVSAPLPLLVPNLRIGNALVPRNSVSYTPMLSSIYGVRLIARAQHQWHLDRKRSFGTNFIPNPEIGNEGGGTRGPA